MSSTTIPQPDEHPELADLIHEVDFLRKRVNWYMNKIVNAIHELSEELETRLGPKL